MAVGTAEPSTQSFCMSTGTLRPTTGVTTIGLRGSFAESSGRAPRRMSRRAGRVVGGEELRPLLPGGLQFLELVAARPDVELVHESGALLRRQRLVGDQGAGDLLPPRFGLGRQTGPVGLLRLTTAASLLLNVLPPGMSARFASYALSAGPDNMPLSFSAPAVATCGPTILLSWANGCNVVGTERGKQVPNE